MDYQNKSLGLDLFKKRKKLEKTITRMKRLKKIKDLNPRIRHLQKELKQLTQKQKKLKNDLKELDKILNTKLKILQVKMEQMEVKENIKQPCTPSLNGNYWTTDNSKRIKKKKAS